MYKALHQSEKEFPKQPENRTGIPAQMKQQMEQFSGLAFDSVRVHYSSGKPAQLQAHAYTQGNDIYIAPGQEKHLQHELGHVVQQRQRQIPPTVHMNGVAINLDPALEREADSYGRRAWSSLSGDAHLAGSSQSRESAAQLSPNAKFWKHFYVGNVALSQTQKDFLAHWSEVSSREIPWEMPTEAETLKSEAMMTGVTKKKSLQMQLNQLKEQQRALQADRDVCGGDAAQAARLDALLQDNVEAIRRIQEAITGLPPEPIFNFPLMVYETFGQHPVQLLHIFNQTLQYKGRSICVIGINCKIEDMAKPEPFLIKLARDVDYLRKNIAAMINPEHMAILVPFVWKEAAEHYYDFPYYEVRSKLMEIAELETAGMEHVLYRWIDGDARNDTTVKLDTGVLARLAVGPEPMLLSGVYNWRMAAMQPMAEVHGKRPMPLPGEILQFIPQMTGLIIVNQLENLLRQKIFENIRLKTKDPSFLIVKGKEGSRDYYLPESALIMNRKAHLDGIRNLKNPTVNRPDWKPGSVQDMESAIGFPVWQFHTLIDSRLSVTKPNKVDPRKGPYVPLNEDGILLEHFSRVRQTALDPGHFSAVRDVAPFSAFGPEALPQLVRDIIIAAEEELIMRLLEMSRPNILVNPDALRRIFHEKVIQHIKEVDIERDFKARICSMADKAPASLQTVLDGMVYPFLIRELLPQLTRVMTETAACALLQAPPREKPPLVRYSPPTLMRSAGPPGLLLQNIQRSIVPSRAAAFWNDVDL